MNFDELCSANAFLQEPENVEGSRSIGFLGFIAISISKELGQMVLMILDGAIVSYVDRRQN